MICFTIGTASSYDPALALSRTGQRMYKQGRDEATGYPGGWVWRTAADASEHLHLIGDGAVYQLELPDVEDGDAWNCFTELDPGTGIHSLLVPAVILCRVQNPGAGS